MIGIRKIHRNSFSLCQTWKGDKLNATKTIFPYFLSDTLECLANVILLIHRLVCIAFNINKFRSSF